MGERYPVCREPNRFPGKCKAEEGWALRDKDGKDSEGVNVNEGREGWETVMRMALSWLVYCLYRD
jgi:hypothetical protein